MPVLFGPGLFTELRAPRAPSCALELGGKQRGGESQCLLGFAGHLPPAPSETNITLKDPGCWAARGDLG